LWHIIVQSSCLINTASMYVYVSTGGPFTGAKARLRRDADHSPPSSAEVENE